VIVEIDRIRDINDSRGHAAGDEVLRAVADRLLRTVAVCAILASSASCVDVPTSVPAPLVCLLCRLLSYGRGKQVQVVHLGRQRPADPAPGVGMAGCDPCASITACRRAR
jgi:hypothetical protein